MADELMKMMEELLRRRFGKYRGIVADREPEKLGQLWVTVPTLFGEEAVLANPCVPFAGPKSTGMYFLPEPKTHVWIEFEEGDTTRPVWTGMLWLTESEVPADATAQGRSKRVLRTPGGHTLEFDDKRGQKTVRLKHASKAELELSNDGSVLLSNCDGMKLRLHDGEVLLEDAKGAQLRMNDHGCVMEHARGSRIEMTHGSVTVSSTSSVVVDSPSVSLGGHCGEPLIKGLSFLTKYMTHTHTVAPLVGGPTSPPIPQGESETLSKVVTTT